MPGALIARVVALIARVDAPIGRVGALIARGGVLIARCNAPIAGDGALIARVGALIARDGASIEKVGALTARPMRGRTWARAALALGAALVSLHGWAEPLERGEAAAYIVAANGEIVAARDADTPRAPASLVKLAAAIVVLRAERQRPALLDEAVTIGADAAAASGTRLGLRRGDRIAARDLLAAMIVRSANDACVALALHVAGTTQAFVARLNDLARELQMNDTRIVDPCGHDRPGQASTAADLLRLARAALREPRLVALASERAIRVEIRQPRRSIVARNTNALLGRYPGAYGLKTGVTRNAGHSVIATARQGSAEVVVVLLGATDRWPAAVRLLDFGFDRAFDMRRVESGEAAGRP